MSKPFYVSLPDRGLIHIEGEDRIDFLQGLVTQDVTKLATEKIQYGCLLTPQGRFLHDFFLYDGDDFILLECEGGERAQDLYNRLLRYRLRSKVKISVEENVSIYMIFNGENGIQDPRHENLGARSFEKPTDEIYEEKAVPYYNSVRIENKIAEGSKDLKIEKSLLLEMGIDRVNGVDFDKGCYMGQELTARMHYRNLGKKHVQVLQFTDDPPAPFSDLILNDKVIGNMRSSCANIGLAVIRDDALEELKQNATASNPFRLLG